MVAKKRLFTVALLASIFLCALATFFAVSHNKQAFALIAKNVVTTREDFSLALSQKQSVINVGDIDFGAEPISIELTYPVEIVGKSEKSVFLNAHFSVVGKASDNFCIKFKNIMFNGNFDTQNFALQSEKTFSENFGLDRSNPAYKALYLTGAFNLQVQNCEFFNYASKSGAVLYRLSDGSDGAKSRITITNTKVYGNICEESPIYIVDKNLNLSISNSQFFGNTAQSCAGISIYGANSVLDGVDISNNNFNNFSANSYKYGGGLFVAVCDVVVKNSTISNNKSYNGGGVQLTNANATFYNCKILNNTAILANVTNSAVLYCNGGYGGGLFAISGEGQKIRLENCNISANTATNGGAIAVMPAHQNARGGCVELLFCNIGLNTQADAEAIKYYGYSQQNNGVLLVQGCVVVDETSLKNNSEDYNYISQQNQALLDGVITAETLVNAKTNGLVVEPNSKANISVPKNVCKLWDLQYLSSKNRKIGVCENEDNTDNNLIILLATIIPAVAVILTATILVIKKSKQGVLAKNGTLQTECAKNANTTTQTMQAGGVTLVAQPNDKNNLGAPSNAGVDASALSAEQVKLVSQKLQAEFGLSTKETEVMELALLGKQRKQIATACFVTEHAIKKHLSNIYCKLDVTSKKELIAKAKTYIK